jgi:hypothetical protein
MVVVVVPGVVQVVINMTLDLVAVAFSPTALADHVFPHVVPTFLKWDMACLVFFSNTFPGQMIQHWYPSQFTNPSVVPFAHPMSFY